MAEYHEVTHYLHDVMNPSTVERLDQMGDLLRVDAATRVLDIACGYGELLLRWWERHGSTGVGVDSATYTIRRAREQKAKRAPEAGIDFIQGRGEEYQTDERFDVASCVGASWVWGGYEGTLDALRRLAKPGGILICGEPYVAETPPDDYLEGSPHFPTLTLHDCYRIAQERGLGLIWAARSTQSDWDGYDLMHAAGLDRFTLDHPDDPDLPEIAKKVHEGIASYLRDDHRYWGWALWAFRAP